MLHVDIRHPSLAAAVVSMLRTELGDLVTRGSGPPVEGDIVVSTTQDLSPAQCRAVANLGISLIVLAPTLTDDVRQRYLSSGAAALLEMTADTGALLAAISTLMQRSRPEPNGSSPADSRLPVEPRRSPPGLAAPGQA